MSSLLNNLPDADKLSALLVEYGMKFLIALLVLLIGLWFIKLFTRMLRSFFRKRELDAAVKTFLLSLISVTLKILLVISVVATAGVQMTSFVALLGAAGLAVGMALSGTLQNFAGGVVLLVLKPFKVGDFIEAQGFAGSVTEIQMFHTILTTPDKKRIVIPNASLSSGSLINYTAEPVRRIEWIFGISYGDSIDKSREIIMEILAADSRVHIDPAPQVLVKELADSSVDLAVRVWVNLEDYWTLFFDINERVKKEFDNRGITIPFPQREITMRDTALPE